MKPGGSQSKPGWMKVAKSSEVEERILFASKEHFVRRAFAYLWLGRPSKLGVGVDPISRGWGSQESLP